MTQYFSRRILILTIACTGAGVAASAAPALGQEFGSNTPYYEDDGLLDITEWFDGNDYNPTDETWWRWDDETYQASKDTGGDGDSDRSSYGYTARDDNDWYYDYYDPYAYGYYDADNDGVLNYASYYRDYDNDGVIDAFVSYSDRDGDGLYDDWNYYSFSNGGSDKQRQQAKDAGPKESRQQKVTGQVQRTKTVKVRGGGQHTVAEIRTDGTESQGQTNQTQGQSGPQPLIVDLGRTDGSQMNLKTGDTITVSGPKVMVGQKAVMLARSIESGGKTTQIDRNAKSMSGTIVNTHLTKVRGRQHQLAIVDLKSGDKTRKIAVDLGPADKFKADLTKGTKLTFSGYPVKVKDRAIVVAQSAQVADGQRIQIDRQMMSVGQDRAQPAGQRQQGQGTPTTQKSPSK